MKLRWPVAKIIVAGTKDVEEAIRSLESTVLDQTNAKKLEFVGQAWENLVVVAQPVKNVIGPAFKKDAPAVREAIEKADGKKLKTTLEKDGKAKLGKGKNAFEVTSEMVNFTTALPENVVGNDFPGGSVYVDTVVSDELKAEALSRELTRRIQEMRKEMGLNVEDKITVEAAVSTESQKALKKWTDHIASETRATKLSFSKEPKGSHVKEWELEDEKVVIGLAKN
jgi:isoleucyl-tRNA synthetase